MAPARTVVCVVVVAALASLLLVESSTRGQLTDACGVLAAGVLAFLAGLRTVRTTRHATLSLGSVAVLWALFHSGPAAAVVVAALSGVAAVLAPKPDQPLRPLVGIYAVGSLTVTAWVAGQVFTAAGGQPGAVDLLGLAIPAAVAAGAYHLVNCALVSLISGLTAGVPWSGILREQFALSALSQYAGAGLALLVHLTWQVAGVWPLLAALPVLYALHVTLRRTGCPAQAEQG